MSYSNPWQDPSWTPCSPPWPLAAVAYGQASGASNQVSVDTLMDRSIGVIGFWLTPALSDRAATRQAIENLLNSIASGRLRPIEGPAFPIARAADAHEMIAARGTIGKVTLTADDADWADPS